MHFKGLLNKFPHIAARVAIVAGAAATQIQTQTEACWQGVTIQTCGGVCACQYTTVGDISCEPANECVVGAACTFGGVYCYS